MTAPAAPPPSEAQEPPRRPGRRTVVVAGSVAAAAVVAGGAVALTRGGRDDAGEARNAADALAAAWSAGRWADAPLAGAPADPAAEYARLAGGLASPPPRVGVVSADTARAGDGTASAELEVTFDLAGHGAQAGSTFAYRTTAALRREGEGDAAAWRAVWAPALVHPALAQGATLVLERTQPPRADVLGRDGLPVVTETDVVDVGVQPSRTPDAAATSAALAGLLGVDAAGLTGRVQQASPDAFVEVITLRRTDYDAQRDALQAVPGAVFRTSTLPLAPTRAFARALLGGVGQVTAEVVEASGGRYAAGDLAGLSGLQARYDERLAGRVGVVVRAAGGTTALSQELATVPAVPGETVRVSLENAVQQAADEALAGVASPSALVAVDTATGEVLAVANGPATGGDRALTGRFPPGSTFKVVTTLALLGGGFDPGSTVACTPTYTVDGRSFRNFEGEAFGDVPFRQDFALSCNTAFASLSPRLGDDELRTAAAQLGLGVPWAAGVDAFAGDVPVTESDVDRAAASFGQGRTLVSPLGMAVVAASVAAGALRRPAVVLDPAPAPAAGPGVEAARPEDLATVAGLMREVVTAGTATVLADTPGAPVHAKTGTAEHGTGDPLPTHAWVIGWQGTTAFAVFVTDGASGGTVAAPVARDFLARTAAATG
ncbi:penicillin-binding protein [Kineococcus sp. R8]|uniref:penicillin-binding transpeptidase domain-containing protein n=1 Tax=Kineococcus siccus TaxID=2696567 RepID=UPI0014121DA9|nr:penicillin-binding transpeptidase domain-containing protein [Kineococcus siccus]NAZ84153.1 penicillin-binding protein [Kineococcus siccus]